MLKVKGKKVEWETFQPKSDSKMFKVSPIKTRFTKTDSDKNGLKIVSDFLSRLKEATKGKVTRDRSK